MPPRQNQIKSNHNANNNNKKNNIKEIMNHTNNLPTLTDDYCIKEFGWNKSQFEVIQRTYFDKMGVDEIKIFAHVCKHTGLDPFLKQIYPVMRQGKLAIQTAIDGFRLIAERTGRYSPGREPTFTYNKDGRPNSATAYIKKMTADGTWHEVAATAYFDEYNPGVGPFWKKMPHTMIAKCAEALALRKAFPAELSSVNTGDEMDQAGLDPAKLPETKCEDITPNNCAGIAPNCAEIVKEPNNEEPKTDPLDVKISNTEFQIIHGFLDKMDEKTCQECEDKILGFYKIDSLEDLTIRQFKSSCVSLQATLKKLQESVT